MRRIALGLAALALLASPASAVPPVAGGALASSNVDLVASIPDVPAIGGELVGRYLYVTTTAGLRIYDTALVPGSKLPVLVGQLPLPHFENEDVDTNGSILLIAADHFVGLNNSLYVVDVSNPNVPLLRSRLSVSAAHTATCINNCTYAWLGGAANRVYVVDLRNPAAPVNAGFFSVPGWAIHDVDVDAAGVAWVSTGEGLYGFDTTNPVAPALLVKRESGTAQSFNNDFIIHNSQRPDAQLATPSAMANTTIDPGEVVLVTEEDYLSLSNGLCGQDGSFQTGWYRTVGGTPVLERLDTFNVGAGVSTSRKPFASLCSSHWFAEHEGVVAVSWYEQGTRFLDVSNPHDIRQIGYFMPAVAETWAPVLNYDAATGTLWVYSFDYARGIDVLTFSGRAGDPSVLAPIATPGATLSGPSPTFGWACRVPGSHAAAA